MKNTLKSKELKLSGFIVLVILILFNTGFNVFGQKPTINKNIVPNSREYNFMIANDFGKFGNNDQKPIAMAMAQWASNMNIRFVIAAGDMHHQKGVKSVNDSLWSTDFESLYPQNILNSEWYPILGNHEYMGNTQAVLDYSKINKHWIMPSRYYTLIKKIDNKTSLRLIFIDTTPLIDLCRNDAKKYPDAEKQNYKAQLHFIDSVLSVSTEQWKIVIGHHPIYGYTKKDSNERTDMQLRLDPILKKYGVDFYISGHIHNFQHIKQIDSPVDYFINNSCSLSRPVKSITGTQFCSDKSGFSVCSVTSKKLSLYFLDSTGEIIYSYSKKK